MNDPQIPSRSTDNNPDPITGEPGSHPVGTGLGAAGAGATGAAIGTVVGGPIGGLVGAVVGAVAGGYAGKGAAEAIDPTAEDAYWRDAHANQSYSEGANSYEDYAPAYRAGYQGYAEHGVTGGTFENAESALEQNYDKAKGASEVGWDKAKHATRAAWERMQNRTAGDANPSRSTVL